jgi:exosortase A-associated hydrolase 1
MGDAEGSQKTFENLGDDIRAAIDAFFTQVPGLRKVVLWGLCDGASAASLYAASDERVAGLVLVNPWVRTEQSEAETYLKRYYFKRALEARFWRKLVSGEVSILRTFREVLSALRKALGGSTGKSGSYNDASSRQLPQRMLESLQQANLDMLFVLSGADYVANEFDQMCGKSDVWKTLVDGATLRRIDAADHTFSRAIWANLVAEYTAEWLHSKMEPL